eukprot:CAMPEP_0173382110 /NCGR_PEP_ID=MMETSP1356-20130122/4595_1 /TAXON_ID=77927 ORGANISM="Hemiselmis virescens, Strain PCC157" /NCGR_SAMPLE_ID=MMETSP1356 /ASSEMBLY_ACC=CAM_ASM_000847 /LENGTH=85 /DNA_ID=CAMNT_0014336289 /DNA_START=70 /DNA_END=323 /DNA_ORIENTATION=-
MTISVLTELFSFGRMEVSQLDALIAEENKKMEVLKRMHAELDGSLEKFKDETLNRTVQEIDQVHNAMKEHDLLLEKLGPDLKNFA